MLGKAPTLKRFEYSLLGKKLKAQTDITQKQYQGLDKAFVFDKNNENVNELLVKKERKKYNKSNIIYNRLRFYINRDYKRFNSLSFKSKYSYPLNFYDDLQKLVKMKLTKLGKRKEKRKCMIQSVNYIIKCLKIIVMNIKNYQMLKKIILIKNSSL